MSKLTFDGTLPEHCYDCPIHNPGDGRCQIDGRSSDYRPFWCPLTVATPVEQRAAEHPEKTRKTRGKWIDKGYHEEWTFECSACGGPSPEEYDFCPHCGADMQLTVSDEKKRQTYTEELVKGTYDGVVIRADAIDALFCKAHTKPAVSEDDGIHYYLDCYEAMGVIKTLPSATVEPTAREILTGWATVCHHYDNVPCEDCPLHRICGPGMIRNIDAAISSVKSALRLVQEHKDN